MSLTPTTMATALIEKIQSYVDKPLEVINEIETITHDSFYKNHIKKNKPVVMTKMMNDWNATKTWDLEYFKTIGKDKTITIPKGNNFQEETKWETGSFTDYINQIENTADADANYVYLLNLSILKLFPHLIDDVDFSLISNYKVRQSTSLWVGPKGTITGWHTDRLADNILAQIKGRKLVLLVNPNQSSDMYPSNKYEPGSRLSSVSLEKFDAAEFPLFKKNVQIYYTILEPGKMVFIPQNWWHCVYGLEISISSNNFGFSRLDNYKMKAAEFSKRKLHNLGLYGKECVCHYYDESGKRHKRS